VATIAPSHRRVAFGVQTGVTAKSGLAYVEPQPPAPESVIAEQSWAELTPDVVAGFPELQDQLEAEPYDMTWITAAAVFNLEQVREEFRQQVEDRATIPSTWYYDRLFVLDVKVERQEMVDGAWSESTTVLQPLPGQMTMRTMIEDDPDAATRNEIINALREPGMQEAILQPTFYETTGGGVAPPDPRIAQEIDETLTEEERVIVDLRRRISRYVTEREGIIQRIEDLGGKPGQTPGDDDKPPPPGRPPGPGGRGSGDDPPPQGAPGGDIGIGTGDPNDGKRGRGDDEAAIKNLQKKLQRLDRRIVQLQERLRRLQPDAEMPGDDGDDAPRSIIDSEDVVIWAYDLGVEPGQTFRYRFTVELYNPFFGRKLDLIEEQHDLADGLVLASTTSTWSEPIEVRPWQQLFVTRAYSAEEARGQLGLGRATAEVFVFSHGRWWKETFSVEPGDRIGLVRSREDDAEGPEVLDFRTRWYLLDVVRDVNAARDAVESGYGSNVLLQHLERPTQTEWLSPARIANSSHREFLQDQVDLAEIGGELASGGV
jgi:hypothetical protein